MQQAPSPARRRSHLEILAVILVVVVLILLVAGSSLKSSIAPPKVSPLTIGNGFLNMEVVSVTNGVAKVQIIEATEVVNTGTEGVMNVVVTVSLVNGTFGGQPSEVSELGSIPSHGMAAWGNSTAVEMRYYGTVGPPKPDFVYVKITLSCDGWPDSVYTYTLGVPAS